MTKLHIQVTKQYNGQHIVRVDNTIREAFAKKKKSNFTKSQVALFTTFQHFPWESLPQNGVIFFRDVGKKANTIER